MKIDNNLERINEVIKRKEIDQQAKIDDAKKLDKTQQVNNTKANNIKNTITEPNDVKISISNKAKELALIKEIIKTDKENDSDKIARIKKLINEGKYEPPIEKVADKLLEAYLDAEI